MKPEEILTSIGVPKNKHYMHHARSILKIYDLFSTERICTVKEESKSFTFGLNSNKIKRNGKDTGEIESEGHKIEEGKKITVTTERGATYSVTLPDKSEIYYQFCDLLNIKNQIMKKEKDQKPTIKFGVPAAFYECLLKAKAFVAKDKLRPALECICIEIIEDEVQIFATNAHVLYISRKFKLEKPIGKTKETRFMFNAVNLPKIRNSEPFDVAIDEKHISLLGFRFIRFTENAYPDVKVVIPDFDKSFNSLSFDRTDMLECIKLVMPYTNRTTSRIDFLFNGNITMTGNDIDFKLEGSQQMNWITKNVRDTAISFSGLFLKTVLDNLKADHITMLTTGHSKRACIFTDGIDSILLMPLQNEMATDYLPEQFSKQLKVKETMKAQTIPAKEAVTKEPVSIYGDPELDALANEFGGRFVFDKTTDGRFVAIALDDAPIEINIRGVRAMKDFRTKLKAWERQHPDSLQADKVANNATPKQGKVRSISTKTGKLPWDEKAPKGLPYDKWLPFWVRYARLKKAKETNNKVREERLLNQSKNTFHKYQRMSKAA